MTAEPPAPRAVAAPVEHVVARWLARVAALLIAAITLLIGVDILTRALLARPLRGVAELVTLAMPACVFLVLPLAWQRGALVRAGRVAAHGAGARDVLGAGVALVVTLAIALVTLPLAWRAWREGEFLGVAGDFTVPSWPALGAVVLGSTALALTIARGARAQLAVVWRRAPARLLLSVVVAASLVLPCVVIESRAGVGALSVALLLLLIAAGMPVAFALLAVAALGIAALKGSVVIAANALGLAATGAVSSYVFGAVPLFVLLGLVMGRADIGRDALLAAHWLLRGVAGGLGVATVVANALFAAMTGISIASAAIFGKVAVPPLIEQGYPPRFAVGLVAGSSVLGMLIPP
ncbi:MAG: TRAP transporter large permease subunit, partial [Gammaproteobacteria bacterium]